LFLQKSAEGIGGGKDLVGCPHGQQPVGIDGFQQHWQLPAHGANHPGQEETGVIIGHEGAGTGGDLLQQSAATTWRAFDPAGIGMTISPCLRCVVPHSLNHEGMQPATGPAIVAAQRLKDQQRPLQGAAVFQCAIKRKIEMQSAIRCHPVHHKIACTVDSLIVDPANSNVRNCLHLSASRGVTVFDWDRTFG